MRSRFVAVVMCSALCLAACQEDPRQSDVETYLEAGGPHSDKLTVTADKFEALVNAHPDPTRWDETTDAEMQRLIDVLTELHAEASAMPVPGLLTETHPLLLEAIDEMRNSMQGIADASTNPAATTASALAATQEHASRADTLASRYIEETRTRIQEAYPDLLEE